MRETRALDARGDARVPVIEDPRECYGVASICRLLEIIGLFCRISSFL